MNEGSSIILLEPATNTASIHDYGNAFLAGFSSKETRLAYGRDLSQYFKFLAEISVDPLAARRPHVDLFMRWQEDRGLKNNTRSRRLAAVRSWYEWLVDEEVLAANPARRVKAPRKETPELSALTRHEMHRFLAAAEELGGYDFAVISLMGMCALRVSEATGGNLGDIITKDWVPVLTVHGKGDKDRYVIVPPMVMGALSRAWGERKDGPLLLNRWGKRMTRENVVGVINRVLRAADIDKRLTPHSMRRSAIQIALDSGVQLRDVQKWVGHASVETTLAYDRRAMTTDRSPGWAVMQAVA